MDWVLKALLGAAMVILIQALAQTKNYYLAGLAPLFPTFALISHYLVGTQRTVLELKETIIFSIFSLVPYFMYLVSLYYLVGRFSLVASLTGATGVWLISAAVLIKCFTAYSLQ